MAIEFQVDSLDTVEESNRGAYEEREGKFHFNPDKYAEIKASGLKLKNQDLVKRLEVANGYKARAEKFKDVTDDDWDDYQTWKSQPPPEPGDKGKQAEFERAIANEKKRFERDLNAAKTEAAQKDQQLSQAAARIREFEIWGPVRDLAIAAKVLPDRLEAFTTLIKTQGRFDLDENGKLIFKDKDGSPTTLTPDKAFATELKNEFAWAFEASGAGGSGAGKSNGGKSNIDLSKMNATERLKYAREHNYKE